MRDVRMSWIYYAPEPEAVLSRVLTIVAKQVKTMSDRRLRLEDHTRRMRLVLAAEFYYDFWYQMIDGYVSDAALELAELHRRFAEMALHLPAADSEDGIGGRAAEAVEGLESVAEECFLARGRICGDCGLPLCLHSDKA